MLRWIDTHNHLFVFEETQQISDVAAAARVGVVSSLVCAGDVETFDRAKESAHRCSQGYACGIHPLYIRQNSWEQDLELLENFLSENLNDKRLVAIGECGLDFSDQCSVPHDIQEQVFARHLKLARKYDLPLSLHGRAAMDILLKYIRRLSPQIGVVHAFNGSPVQAELFIKNGFKLGYGGAMTYDGSKRIRKLFSELPDEAWVLETDCPDMPPSWKREENPQEPHSSLSDIAQYGVLASHLRKQNLQEISEQSIKNTLAIFPKFMALL